MGGGPRGELRRAPRPASRQYSLATVVVPTHGRPSQLRTCLEALGRLDYPPDRLEVVVVDDGSPQPVTEAVSPPTSIDVRIERQPQGGPGAARNRGVALAKGDVIAFLDDDCVPDPSWLTRLVKTVESGEKLVAGGRTVNALDSNAYSEASQMIVSYLYEMHARTASSSAFFTTNNLALRRDDFLAVGGFDERFRHAAGEDRDLCVRLARAGTELRYAPDALVRHAHALTFRSFWRQHAAYGRAARELRHTDVPGRVEPVSFYLGLVAQRPSDGRHRRASITALLAVSQLATAVGFARATARARRSS